MIDRTSVVATTSARAAGLVLVALSSLSVVPAAAQDKPGFDFFGEVNFNFRDSSFVEYRLNVPFPPEFWEPGDDAVYLRTVDPGSHFELSDVDLGLDVTMSDLWSARALVHVVDLYNRNPTSTDTEVFLRELWIRFGTDDPHFRPLKPWAGYIEVGKAPRFAKQTVRHLESYGLWETAVNRFEAWQVQAGINLGGSFYLRGQYGIVGPLFMRDPNALAGDNGTFERVPGDNNPTYNSGFPILYDAQLINFDFDGEWEAGFGLGWRWAREDGSVSVDALAWYFERKLADAPEIDNTYYQGDLELLRGAGLPLPFEGDQKWEAGLNVEWRLNKWLGFLQVVRQEIAGLEREGFEIETALNLPVAPLFAAWDEPVLNWIRPAVRYSQIDNGFWVPDPFITPSMYWDWRKFDIGLRFGIVRTSDLTVEYSYNDAQLHNGTSLHPNEWLVTWRIFW